jgi:hypothetical protein
MRSRYRELGIELGWIYENYSRQPKKPPMAKEKRDEKVGYPFKMFLKEALV